ncbi:MAG: hypothetical protein ACW98Y_08910 [Candidatus Thorarchaeota archaeon]|jgi:hypothetical protein
MAECSHCGRPIPTDEAEQLRKQGHTPLLCQACAPSDKEKKDLSDAV